MKRNVIVGFGVILSTCLALGCSGAASEAGEGTQTSESAVQVDAKLHYSYPISYYNDKSFSARLSGSNHPPYGTIEIKKNAGQNNSHYGIRATYNAQGANSVQIFDLETGEFSVEPTYVSNPTVTVTPPPDQGSNVFAYVQLVENLKTLVEQVALGSLHPYPGPPDHPNPELNETSQYLASVISEIKGSQGLTGIQVEFKNGGYLRSGSKAKVTVSYRATSDSDIWIQACNSSSECYDAQTANVAASQAGKAEIEISIASGNGRTWPDVTAKLLPRGGNVSQAVATSTKQIAIFAPEEIVCNRHNYFPDANDPKLRVSFDWKTTEPRDVRLDVFDRDTMKWLWGVQKPLSELVGQWDNQAFDFPVQPKLKVFAKLLPRGGTWDQAILDSECL